MKRIVSLSVAFVLIGLNLYAGDLKVTGKLGIGTTNPQAMLDVNQVSGGFSDGFEDNNLSEYTLSGNANWSTTSGDKKTGTYSAKAGTIYDGGYTSMKITKTVPAGNITFARKVSSEANYDYLIFYIDGQVKDLWSGEHAWATVSYAVAAGTHTFEWIYSKDESVNTGSDTAWVDDFATSVAAGPAAIFNGGNVGIGTTIPNTFLQVGDAGGKPVTALTGYIYWPNIYNKNTQSYDKNGNNIPVALMGESSSGRATVGITQTGHGVYGTSVGGTGVGVFGNNDNPSGFGLWCQSTGNTYGCGGNRAWYYSSDENLKENIATLDEALPKVKRLRGVKYNWKDDSEKKRQVGMIAQEVMEVVPEAVGLDPDGNLAMADGPIVALLTEAVKEQQRQIEAQQAQIEALMAEVEKLKKKQ